MAYWRDRRLRFECGQCGQCGETPRGKPPRLFVSAAQHREKQTMKQKERKKQATRNSEVGKDYASHLTFLFGLVELSWWNYVAVKLSEIRLRTEAKPRIFSTTVPHETGGPLALRGWTAYTPTKALLQHLYLFFLPRHNFPNHQFFTSLLSPRSPTLKLFHFYSLLTPAQQVGYGFRQRPQEALGASGSQKHRNVSPHARNKRKT